ncbi:acetyl-CoA carboxylase carboxyltransferase subunit alpha [Opitutales bacterium ASA1]|uniref:acetyl-CoA carboxylase carboxyltransferase subunit alpha n=1 Tax=Congregicoccus parvus TaxID=3081749 RepID=UPI002B317ADA|nr:acetyl-CoA carboxylase carboxyltransferase subunit alpha [Opitutales bacterium ASA1]
MDKPTYTLEFEKPLRDLGRQLESLHQLSIENNVNVSSEIAAIEDKIAATKKLIYSNLTAWQRVQIARHPKRPYTLDFVQRIFTGFQEYHGDRCFSDDRSIVGGTAFLDGEAVVVIGQQKGRDTKENILRNFGMPNPEGYRKALRLMRMAEKFGLPVITFVDTPGAYPGIGAEERHVAEAIAVNLREMAVLETPIVTTIIGEGGSGGALGIAVSDRVLIFENSYYSVISPEGCAAILWKDRASAPRAAEALKIDPASLARFGIVDEVIDEPFGGNHVDLDAAAANLKAAISRHLRELEKLPTERLLDARYDRYRNLGVIAEPEVAAVPVASVD